MPPAPRRLLVTVAHPDDETFGMGSTIAHYAAAGVEVHVGCATRGEAGEIAPGSDATPETLGEAREAELRAAAAVMGVKRVHLLGFRDSGMIPAEENDDPGAFVNASEADVIVAITRLIRAVRPHVVLTMARGGATGHPDHIRVSQLTTKAFKLAGHPGYIEPGGIVHAPAKLYYMEFARSRINAFIEAAISANPGMEDRIRASGIENMGSPDEEITAAIDVSDVIDRRLAAVEEHRSQPSPFSMVPEELLPAILGEDQFVRGIPAWQGGDRETDLFQGL